MARRTTLKTNCFGLPYMGSKNGIARKIVAVLPRATHFYDLFCGGCAITHVAMLSEKWQQYHINDISMMPQLFVDAVNGKYANESRWISREDFMRLKDTDPYVACVWSFGNDCQTYMYGKDVEPFKKALHEVHFAETKEQRTEAMARYRRLLAEVDRGLTTDQKTRSGNVECLQSLQRLQSLQSLQRLQRLQRLQLDYRDVPIEDDAVIYCDPPYADTHEYTADGFDHDAFYSWCLEQTQPLFISEYYMPKDEFVCVAEWRKASLFRNEAGKDRTFKIEKLFRPRKQVIGD